MLPYTVIKEANPPEASGTATGVVNFLNFTFSALLGRIFAWLLVSAGGGAATAIVLTFFLNETGPAGRQQRTVLAA